MSLPTTPPSPSNATDTANTTTPTTPPNPSTASPPPTCPSSTHKSPPSTSLNAHDTPQALKAQSEARAAVLASLTNTGAAHDATYTARAADVHANAAALARQEREVRRNATALGKQSDGWAKELDRQVTGLKQFGDLQNWAEMIESEFCVLEETLRLVEGGTDEDGGLESGGSRWRPGE